MFTRKTFKTLTCWSLAAFSIMATLDNVQAAFPEQPVKILVGFPAGQASDTSARRIAAKMGEVLKQSVLVDNRPGAAGIISHTALKNSPPDGYTILMGSSGTLVINPALYSKLAYDPIKDFEPVALVAAAPLVMFTSANSPINNLKELIALAKANPGKVTYGSSGSGTTGHIAMELLKKQAGIFMLHIPYKGSPQMVTDVAGGQVDVAFDTAASVLQLAKSGRVKLIGIANAKRFAIAPDLPTLSEQGLKGFEAVAWSAIMAPKGTPPDAISQLNKAINVALKDPAVLETFAASGSYPLGGSADDLQKFMAAETLRWGKAVKDSGAQID